MKSLKSLCFIAFSLLILVSCSGNKKQSDSYDTRTRKELVDEIEKMKSYLPTQIPNTPMTIEDVSIDGNIVELVYSMPKSFYELYEENMSSFSDVANSEKNVARLFNLLNQEMVEKFIDAGVGLRCIYKCSDTGEILMTIEADCDRLKRVKEGVANGEIVPYSILEIFQMDIDKHEFPCEIEEGLWMTDGYIRGKTVYYIANLESDITSNDLSYSDIQEMKQGILEGLKETLVGLHKKEMAREGIRIIYIYKNNNGDEFARVEITADDL